MPVELTFPREDGIVQHPCSNDFLITICIEFCKAQSHQMISRLRDLEQPQQSQRLEFLAYEVMRLFQHPQLFPSDSSRIRFLSFLAADSRLQLCEAISSMLMQNEMQTMHVSWRKNVSRKGYIEGTRGWENFLLSDAPGLPFDSDRTEPKSMVQVMPPVASRIIADFEREEREILRFVEQVCKLFKCFGLGFAASSDVWKEQPTPWSPSANDNDGRLCKSSSRAAFT